MVAAVLRSSLLERVAHGLSDLLYFLLDGLLLSLGSISVQLCQPLYDLLLDLLLGCMLRGFRALHIQYRHLQYMQVWPRQAYGAEAGNIGA